MNNFNCRLFFIQGCLYLALVIMALILAPSKGFTQEKEYSKEYIQKWILNELSNGQIANLRNLTGYNLIEIDGLFIQNLISGKYNLTASSIRIENARVCGKIRLGYEKIKYNIDFSQCIFTDSLFIICSQFAEDLTFYNCYFYDCFSIDRCDVAGTLSISSSNYTESASFFGIKVKENFIAVSTTFANKKAAMFYGATIEGDCIFRESVFYGGIDLRDAIIKGVFDGSNMKYLHKGYADYSYITIGRHLLIISTEFASGCSFSNSNIGGNLYAVGAKFDNGCDFTASTIAGNIYLDSALFKGDTCVSFSEADIGNNFSAYDIIVKSITNFRNIIIGGDLIIKGGIFTDSASIPFSYSVINGMVILDSSTFYGSLDFRFSKICGNFSGLAIDIRSDSASLFWGIQVGGSVIFRNAKFSSSVDLIASKIDEDLSCSGLIIMATDTAKDQFRLNRVIVKNSLFLDSANISVKCNFTYCDIGSYFSANSAVFDRVVDFNFIKVGGPFIIANSLFKCSDMTYFGSAKCGSDVVLDSAIFAGPIFWRGSDINGGFFARGTKILEDSSKIQKSDESETMANFKDMDIRQTFALNTNFFEDKINVDNMKFGEIVIDTNKNVDSSAYAILKFANNVKYSSQFYSSLESYFRSKGLEKWADETYIAQRRRQRFDTMTVLSFPWLWDQAQDILVGYGRRTHKILLPCVGVLLISTMIFRQKAFILGGRTLLKARSLVKYIGPQENVIKFNAFWFSLSHFLPIIKFPDENYWVPISNKYLLWISLRLIRLLGWFLVPFAVASWTGIIK
jgi:hypothetical protein